MVGGSPGSISRGFFFIEKIRNFKIKTMAHKKDDVLFISRVGGLTKVSYIGQEKNWFIGRILELPTFDPIFKVGDLIPFEKEDIRESVK